MSVRPARLQARSRGGFGWGVWLLAVTSALLGLLPGSTRAEEDPPVGAPQAAPRTYALLIGCTEYPRMRRALADEAKYRREVQLLGCQNDVRLMAETLVDRMGARREDLVVLEGADEQAATFPSRANILTALKRLASRTYGPGDRVVVLYAGHGVQQPDDDGDEIDGLDESWFVADSSSRGSTDFEDTIRDEDIGEALRAVRARGATVWCIMDCCHSATGMRGVPEEETRTRGLDPAALGMDIRPSGTRSLGDPAETSPMGDSPGGDEGLVVFYAAQSFQKDPEVVIGREGQSERTTHGLLTIAVVRALERAGPEATYADLYEGVLAGYRDLNQHQRVQPLVEGDLQQRTFGGGRVEERRLSVTRTDDGLLLGAGALLGLKEGTELDLYPTGYRGDAAKLAGRVRVSRVALASSQVLPVPGTDTGWAAKDATYKGPWDAVVAKLVVGETGVPIAFIDEVGGPVAPEKVAAAVLKVLDEESMRRRFPRPADPTRARWGIVIGSEGRPLLLRPVARGRGATEFQVDTNSLETTLRKIYKVENLLELYARDRSLGRLPTNLRLELRLQTPDGAWRPVTAGETVPPGTQVEIALRKERPRAGQGEEALDVWVFWVDAHYGVTQIYPRASDTSRLTKDDVGSIPVLQAASTTDWPQGQERLLVFAAPAQAQELRLDFLEQDALEATRGAGSGAEGAGGLLEALAFGEPGTRGVSVAERGRAALSMWMLTFTTAWGNVRIPARTPQDVPVRVARPASAAAAGAPPDAWTFGSDVRLARAGPEGPFCLLVAEDETTRTVLVDLDGEVPEAERTPETVGTLVQERRFDAEMALRIEPGRVLAWYDRDDDGVFDLVLVDANGDRRAEERHVLSNGTWTSETDLDLPLLGTGHLTYLRDLEDLGDRDARGRAIERLAALAGE